MIACGVSEGCRRALTSSLRPFLLVLCLLSGMVLEVDARLRDSYEIVTHVCGAVERFVPAGNLVVVGFTPGAGDEANFELAVAEGLLVRTPPAESARDGAAVYALPPGEDLTGACERLLAHAEVKAVMPALVPESGARALFLHPASFTAELQATTDDERQQAIDTIREQLGLTAEPTTPRVPGFLQPGQSAPPPPPNLIKIWVPPGGDLFDELERVSQLEVVQGVGLLDLQSKLSQQNDSYLIGGERRDSWYVHRSLDGGRVTEIRHDFLEIDSLLVVEFEHPLEAAEFAALQAEYGLRAADPETPDYAEIPAELLGVIKVLATDAGAAAIAERLVEERGDLVRGALPGLLRPSHELRRVQYVRPRNFVLEYPADVDPLAIKLTLQGRDLTEVRRHVDQDRQLLVVEVELAAAAGDLFAGIRGVRTDRQLVNSAPIVIASDNEAQLVAGHRYGRRAPYLSYVDEQEQVVRLYPIDRLAVVTFTAGITAADRQQVAARRGLRLLPVRQNLDLRAPHAVYEVSAGDSSVEVARRCEAAAVADSHLVGAAPVMMDSAIGRLVFAPRGWLRVAFEPKTPQAEIDRLLTLHQLRPALDPNRPVAEDPHLDLRGGFWNFYVSRRMVLIQPPGADSGDLLTRLNRESAVIWAHPYSKSPALDRGSSLVMRNTGGGWYVHQCLDADLNMLVHLRRTTSWVVVEGYAERARLQLVAGLLPVVIEPRPGTGTREVVEALGSIDFGLEVDDGERLYGYAAVDALGELADLPGVGLVRAKEARRAPGR